MAGGGLGLYDGELGHGRGQIQDYLMEGGHGRDAGANSRLYDGGERSKQGADSREQGEQGRLRIQDCMMGGMTGGRFKIV